MNWLDVIIIVLLIISFFSGLANGLIKTVFSLAGLIVGIVLAGRLYTGLSGQLGFITNESVARIVAFIIIFVIVMIIASLLGIIFSKLVSAMLLGWLNRLAGGVLGVFLGAIFIAAILAIWIKYAGGSTAISGSAIAQLLVARFPLVLALLPPEFNSVRPFFQ